MASSNNDKADRGKRQSQRKAREAESQPGGGTQWTEIIYGGVWGRSNRLPTRRLATPPGNLTASWPIATRRCCRRIQALPARPPLRRAPRFGHDVDGAPQRQGVDNLAGPGLGIDPEPEDRSGPRGCRPHRIERFIGPVAQAGRTEPRISPSRRDRVSQQPRPRFEFGRYLICVRSQLLNLCFPDDNLQLAPVRGCNMLVTGRRRRNIPAAGE